MDISLFDYDLNPDLIAQKPCFPRDKSRLLASLGGDIKDLRFRDLHKLPVHVCSWNVITTVGHICH